MTGGSVLNIAMFDKTYGSILLGEVSCDGTEDNIMECNHSSMTNAACMHTEDLAIGCDPGTSDHVTDRTNANERMFVLFASDFKM